MCPSNSADSYLVANAGSSSGLAEDGDVFGVTAKGLDVSLDPGDGGMLVPQAVVT